MGNSEKGKYVQKDSPLCLECGDAINEIKGRSDRKFCCEECRNRYHYRDTRMGRNIKARVKTRLEHNHDILEGLLKMGQTSIGKTEALQMGFDPNYMTTCQLGRGHMDCSCYDISYRVTDSRICKISKCLTTFALAKQNKT